jgi:membrane protein implicated in regulation of membrane protease activity
MKRKPQPVTITKEKPTTSVQRAARKLSRKILKSILKPNDTPGIEPCRDSLAGRQSLLKTGERGDFAGLAVLEFSLRALPLTAVTILTVVIEGAKPFPVDFQRWVKPSPILSAPLQEACVSGWIYRSSPGSIQRKDADCFGSNPAWIEKSIVTERQQAIAMMTIMFAPIFALVLFWVLPFRMALPIYTPIFIFGFIVNFKMMQSMSLPVKTGLEEMIGQEAVAIDDIDPEGKVRINSELWAATAKGGRYEQGEKVKIIGAQGLVLVVEDPQNKGSHA